MKYAKQVARSAGVLCAVTAATLAFAGEAAAAPRTHDGFYLQLDVGLGYLTSSAEAGGLEATYSGVTLPTALWLGGTLGPVVLGGGFFTDYAPSPSLSFNGGASQDVDDASLYLVGLGMFADIYPDIRGGLHVQPFVGWGALESSTNGDAGGSDPTGLILAVGCGYDWWVADQWSIGVMGRIAYAPLSRNDVDFTTIAPAVLATFTYH